MNSLRQVSVRELQHNLSDYLELALVKPLEVTKYGKSKVVLVNPQKFDINPISDKDENKKDLTKNAFIGMYKYRWKGKSSIEIAENLRANAWYGK